MLENPTKNLEGLRAEMVLLKRGTLERDEIVRFNCRNEPQRERSTYRFEVYSVPTHNNFMVVEEVFGDYNLDGDVLDRVIGEPVGENYEKIIRALGESRDNFIYLRMYPSFQFRIFSSDIFYDIPGTNGQLVNEKVLPFLPVLLDRDPKTHCYREIKAGKMTPTTDWGRNDISTCLGDFDTAALIARVGELIGSDNE